MKRPDGVTVISIYHWVEAALLLLGACAVVAVPFIVASVARYQRDVEVAVPIVAIVMIVVIIVLVVLAAANAVVGWGLWRLQSWSRMAAVVLAVLRLVNIPIGTIIGGLILWYLYQPEARAAFGEHVEPEQ